MSKLFLVTTTKRKGVTLNYPFKRRITVTARNAVEAKNLACIALIIETGFSHYMVERDINFQIEKLSPKTKIIKVGDFAEVIKK